MGSWVVEARTRRALLGRSRQVGKTGWATDLCSGEMVFWTLQRKLTLGGSLEREMEVVLPEPTAAWGAHANESVGVLSPTPRDGDVGEDEE